MACHNQNLILEIKRAGLTGPASRRWLRWEGDPVSADGSCYSCRRAQGQPARQGSAGHEVKHGDVRQEIALLGRVQGMHRFMLCYQNIL